MKLLVVGGGGMLGHKLAQVASARFETAATVRASRGSYPPDPRLFGSARVFEHVSVEDVTALDGVFRVFRPDTVVNCVGIVKQLKEAADPIASIRTNALFPHELARVAGRFGARLVHVSTDCVFSGARGRYRESDPPDPVDLYGRSKLLGEIGSPHLTIRTSLIGRELGTRASGLVEWFLAQQGCVRGYRKAVFSGLPTVVLAELTCDVVERHRELAGLVHVSAEPINKYDLLVLLQDAYGKEIDIEPVDDVRIDRSLDSSAFREATGWQPAPWTRLIARMAGDSTPYLEWKSR